MKKQISLYKKKAKREKLFVSWHPDFQIGKISVYLHDTDIKHNKYT